MIHRVALVIIIGIAAIVRIALLDQPMRYDEAVTYVEYVRPATSPLSILQSYRPNNHILHTLLVFVSTRIFGDAEWAIRLPAILAGLALIPAAYLAFRDAGGLLAAALAAGSSPLILYSTNGRGYTLVALFTLIGFIAAQRIVRDNRWRDWIILAIALSLGFWTIPVMLFPCGAILGWLAVHLRKPLIVRFIACLFATAVLTVLLYAPMIRSVGISEITSNKFVITHGIARFLRELRVAPIDIARMWTTGIWWPLAWLLHAAALASIFLPDPHRRHRILPVALITLLVVLFATLRMPPTRVWLWLLPIYLGCAAMTFAWLMRRLHPHVMPISAVALAALMSFTSIAPVRASTDTGAFPAARGVANQLRSHLRTTDRVIASTPADGPLAYYLARLGIEPTIFETVAPRRIFIVVTDDDRVENLLARRGVNANQFNPPDLLSSVSGGKIYAAARRRADPHSGQTPPSDPAQVVTTFHAQPFSRSHAHPTPAPQVRGHHPQRQESREQHHYPLRNRVPLKREPRRKCQHRRAAQRDRSNPAGGVRCDRGG